MCADGHASCIARQVVTDKWGKVLKPNNKHAMRRPRTRSQTNEEGSLLSELGTTSCET
jgi:hypothetical protein